MSFLNKHPKYQEDHRKYCPCYNDHHDNSHVEWDDWGWNSNNHNHSKRHVYDDDWEWGFSHHDHKKSYECDSCICLQLRKLPGRTKVDLFLKGGQVIEDVFFIAIHEKNCCALFSDHDTKHGSTFIVDCRDIQSIRIESHRLFHKC